MNPVMQVEYLCSQFLGWLLHSPPACGLQVSRVVGLGAGTSPGPPQQQGLSAPWDELA